MKRPTAEESAAVLALCTDIGALCEGKPPQVVGSALALTLAYTAQLMGMSRDELVEALDRALALRHAFPATRAPTTFTPGNWRHSMCERCWREREGERVPARVREPERLLCCFCGEPHASGIHVRHDPDGLRCQAAREPS